MLFSESSELFRESGLWFIELIDDDEFFLLLLHDDNEFLDEFLDNNEHNEFLELLPPPPTLPLPPLLPNDFNEPKLSLGQIKQSCKLRSTNIPLIPPGKNLNNPNGCEYNSK